MARWGDPTRTRPPASELGQVVTDSAGGFEYGTDNIHLLQDRVEKLEQQMMSLTGNKRLEEVQRTPYLTADKLPYRAAATTPVDADFTQTGNGLAMVTTHPRLWIRVAGVWRYATLT